MKLPDMKQAKLRNDKSINFVYLDNKEVPKLYNNKKYFIRTYGCQMNMHDSEEIEAILESLGFTKTNLMEESDIVVLNTCAIRENAHDKVFGFLGRCKHLKSTKKDLIICVCGCMAQEKSVCEEILNKYKYIDIVFGTHNKHELRDMLINRSDKLNINVVSTSNEIVENVAYKNDSKVSAWVNIMYGCDKFCTYCIVPYTRGKQRSRKSEDIVKEVLSLKEKGFKEVTLLGQNVNAYGKDREDEVSFAKLLQMVCDTKIDRVRFVTSHPWDFTDEIIDVIANNDNAMNYVHLPVQSGSSKILKLMGRRYTKEDYLTLFNKIKTKVPGISITTDIIVGFPAETDEDFEATIDIVNECKFDGAFTFIFSPRNNTPAAEMEDTTETSVKEERLQRLNEIVNKYYLMNNQKYLDKIVKVLVTGNSEKDKEKYCGYSEEFKLVNIESDKILSAGDIINVKITDAKSFSLDGKSL